jgi:ATP-dependent DNA helicase RecG
VQLLAVIQGEMTRQELMAVLALKDRKHFANSYLKPALAAGSIEMTLPDKPNSGLQKYRKTPPQP